MISLPIPLSRCTHTIVTVSFPNRITFRIAPPRTADVAGGITAKSVVIVTRVDFTTSIAFSVAAMASVYVGSGSYQWSGK